MGMPSGRVKFFNTDRGYGFIAPNDGGPDIFVHVHDVEVAPRKKATDIGRRSRGHSAPESSARSCAPSLRRSVLRTSISQPGARLVSLRHRSLDRAVVGDGSSLSPTVLWLRPVGDSSATL